MSLVRADDAEFSEKNATAMAPILHLQPCYCHSVSAHTYRVSHFSAHTYRVSHTYTHVFHTKSPCFSTYVCNILYVHALGSAHYFRIV